MFYRFRLNLRLLTASSHAERRELRRALRNETRRFTRARR